MCLQKCAFAWKSGPGRGGGGGWKNVKTLLSSWVWAQTTQPSLWNCSLAAPARRFIALAFCWHSFIADNIAPTVLKKHCICFLWTLYASAVRTTKKKELESSVVQGISEFINFQILVPWNSFAAIENEGNIPVMIWTAFRILYCISHHEIDMKSCLPFFFLISGSVHWLSGPTDGGTQGKVPEWCSRWPQRTGNYICPNNLTKKLIS